jgi:hypothetical protein
LERQVPVYMEISRLHRTVTIVARGRISPDEIRSMAQKLTEAQVRSFAKVVEVAGATTEFTPEQVVRLAEFLRGASTEKRGPVAFVVNKERNLFPRAFATATEGDGPIALFTSLREARDWLEQIRHLPQRRHSELTHGVGHTPWSDPERRGVFLRGARQRDVTVAPRAAE